ncbi:hypothetical protein Unana1_01196 [Umbelopsis nana]
MRTSPLYALLNESRDYLNKQNVNGINVMAAKTSHPSFDPECGCDRFQVRIEYCGQNIECQIIFDPSDWQFPPDLILPASLETTFAIEQVASDDWDIRDRTCLFKYLMRLRELFIQEETKRLTSEHPDQVNDLTYSISASPESSSHLQVSHSQPSMSTTPVQVSAYRQELTVALVEAFRNQILECDTVLYTSLSLYVNVRIPECMWQALRAELNRVAETTGVPVDKRMGQVATAVVSIQLSDEYAQSVDLTIMSAINFQSRTSSEPRCTQINCSFTDSTTVQEKVAHIKKTIIQQVPKLHALLPVQPAFDVDLVGGL